MASFKAVVLNRKASGEWKVYVRITHRRRTVHVPTGLTAVDGEVRRGELVGSEVLDRANDLIREMRGRVNAYGPAVMDMDVEAVRAVAERRDDYDRDFFGFCRSHLRQLEEDGREGTRIVHESAVKSLSTYLGRDVLYYDDMTAELMRGYKNHLKRTWAPLTAVRYFATIGTIFRRAKREINGERSDGPIKVDPFKVVKPDRAPQTRKRALSVEDILRIRDAKGLTEAVCRARDLFMLSFYLVGMNGADLFEMAPPKDGYITYNRRKTRTRRSDGALMRLKVPDEAWPILDKYKDKTGKRALKFHTTHADNYGFSGHLAHGIKALGEKIGIDGLTFYAARHTWATLAANVCGVDIYTVEKALCHSPSGLAVTEVYIKPDFSKVDNANRLVLDLLTEAEL